MAHVPILRQRGYLIATLQSAITDREAEDLQAELMEQVSRFRARGVIVDVTVLDVLDSFAARTLRTIAHTTRLRGAHTVLVGVQPEVAFAMVRLGVTMEHVFTALDLEEGLAFLDQLIRRQG
jgi:rsbT antagonist protein RsbS